MSTSLDASELTRSFRRGFAATFAVDLVTKVMGAAMVVILIRGLSVKEYAYVTLLLTLAQFVGSAAGGGVRTRYLREEAEQFSRHGSVRDEQPFTRAVVRSAALLLLVGASAVPLIWATSLVSAYLSAGVFVLYALALAVGLSTAELAIARFQARRQFLAAAAVTAARSAALLAASVLIVLSGSGMHLLNVWFIASVLLVAVVVAGPAAVRGGLKSAANLRVLVFNREEGWLSVYYLAAAGFAYVDVLVAGAMLSELQLASLGAALRYVAIVQSPIPALGAMLRVRTSQVDVIDSPAKQRAMILDWLRRSTLPAALFVAVAAALAPVIIPQIDGGKYPSSVLAFQILLLTAVSAYLTAPAVSMLMAQRAYVFLAGTYVAALLLNAVGDVVVAPIFGIAGIATVSSVVYVAIDVVLIRRALSQARV